jgi:hypothetical protein
MSMSPIGWQCHLVRTFTQGRWAEVSDAVSDGGPLQLAIPAAIMNGKGHNYGNGRSVTSAYGPCA